MQFLFDLDSKGYLKRRESAILEYKQNFQKGDNLLKYLKTLVGMANNKGGMIMFGIQDSPHIPLGMSNTRFQEIDPKEIDGRLREYFAPSIKWRSDILEKELDDERVRAEKDFMDKNLLFVKNQRIIFCERGLFIIVIEVKQKRLNIRNLIHFFSARGKKNAFFG